MFVFYVFLCVKSIETFTVQYYIADCVVWAPRLTLLDLGTYSWNRTCLYVGGLPTGSGGKESACNAGDPCSTPKSGRSPGEGNGYPLQYSCLEKSMDRGAWQATVHEVLESWTLLSDEHFHTFTTLFITPVPIKVPGFAFKETISSCIPRSLLISLLLSFPGENSPGLCLWGRVSLH